MRRLHFELLQAKQGTQQEPFGKQMCLKIVCEDKILITENAHRRKSEIYIVILWCASEIILLTDVKSEDDSHEQTKELIKVFLISRSFLFPLG